MSASGLVSNDRPGPAAPLAAVPLLNLSRMPMLERVFSKIASTLAEDLRSVSENITVSITKIGSETAGRVLANSATPNLAGIFRVSELDSDIIVLMHGLLVFTMLELMFGGIGSNSASLVQRPFTRTEVNIADGLFRRLERAISAGLGELRPLTTRFRHYEPRQDRIEIGRPTAPGIYAVIEVRAGSTSGTATVLLPSAIVSMLRQDLANEPPNQDVRQDPEWRDKFEAAVKETQMTMRAVIRDDSLTLGDIARMTVGQTLKLSVSIGEGVIFESNERALFQCRLSQAGGHYTVEVNGSAAASPLGDVHLAEDELVTQHAPSKLQAKKESYL